METPVIAVFDANVLYAAHVRDLLMWLSVDRRLVQGHWTDQIIDEWAHNLAQNRSDLRREQIQYTIDRMNKAVADARVIDYERHIEQSNLPDENDRHVLAAAIEIHASVIVTQNLKDFPDSVLNQHGMEAISADEFFLRMYDADADIFLGIVRTQRTSLRKPPKTAAEYVQTFRGTGLRKLADLLEQHIDSI